MKERQKIGLFGFGVVGQGLYDIIQNSNLNAEIVKICAKHPEKKRSISMDYFTFDKNDLLNNDDIDLIVESIDDADAAFDITKTALSNGTNVVTSNKKMIAEHLEELVALQKENRASLLYEASACSSIPILRTLEEYYDNDLIESVSGIFNGSSNYILTKIFKHNQDYDIALKQAQDLGFAETDASLDVGGYDALYKLAIVGCHAFGLFIKPEDILSHSIQYISRFDIQYAQEKGAIIKQIASIQRVGDQLVMYVLPQFIYPGNPLYTVDNEYNGVVVNASYCDNQFFYGKGAGGHPTGFAVLSDISANNFDYKYEYKKHLQQLNLSTATDVSIEIYLRYYDKKNLDHFQFQEITSEFKSKQYNYVVGRIKISNLLNIQNVLQTADILMVATGKIFSK